MPLAGICLENFKDVSDYSEVWCQLQRCKAFEGKQLPPKSDPEVWERAGLNFDHVHMSGELEVDETNNEAVFSFILHPLKLDSTHRLGRRFGLDRYFRLITPPLNRQTVSRISTGQHDDSLQAIVNWITAQSHEILGRRWAAFWIKDREKGKRGISGKRRDGERNKKDVFLFATDGCDFLRSSRRPPQKGEAVDKHHPLSVQQMLEWLIPFEANCESTYLKLFARIGLGKSLPAVFILEKPPTHLGYCPISN